MVSCVKEVQMSINDASPYSARMQRVLNYIDDHLEDDLNADVLANVAAFSKFHFQRQFSALFGVTIHRYIQLMRLKRAAFRLAFRKDRSVFEIALDSGYEGPEAFTRSFRKHQNQSPSAFRKDPQWNPWHVAYAPVNHIRNNYMSPNFTTEDVKIIEFPATSVAVKSHHGDPALVGDTIRQFIEWRREAGLPPKKSATFNIFHSDPDETPSDEYQLDICAATSRPIDSNSKGVVSGEIPAGRCAKVRMTGSSDNLRPAISYLYREWLPASGHELRDFPIFVQRVTFFPDVPDQEAVTDIFLPLL